jgi:hypothetical protein
MEGFLPPKPQLLLQRQPLLQQRFPQQPTRFLLPNQLHQHYLLLNLQPPMQIRK